MRVLACGVAQGRALGGPVLVEATGHDVAAVRDHLRIAEGAPGFHCMCLGDLAIELFADEGPDRAQPITTLGFHHARSLRDPAWNSDAMLVDGAALVRWLAARGVPGPLRAHEKDLERLRRADAVRRRWLQAAPPCLGDLARYADVEMLPDASFPGLDEPEARLRAGYASPGHAAHAVLSWFGSGAGPWSGYPAYEGLAENLLMRLGLEVVREVAASHADEPAVMRGAARLFASWTLVTHRKSAVGDVPAAFWEQLRPFVHAMDDADNVDRFEHAVAVAAEVRRLRARGAPRIAGKEGLVTVAVSKNGTLSGLVSDGRSLFTGEANDVVAFERGRLESRVLYRGKDPFFELAGPVSGMLMVSHVNGGTVGKVLTQGSDLIVMARAQQRPLNVVVFPGTVAWLNAAHVPDPVRGAPYSVQRTSVMLFDTPDPRIVRESNSVSSLVVDDECLYWCESEAGRWAVWSFAYRRADPPRRLAIVGEQPATAAWLPRLRVNARHIAWADPEACAIVAIDKRGIAPRPFVLAKMKAPPADVVVDDDDVFALSGEPDARVWHVEHASSQRAGDESTVVASYERERPDRPGMVLDARGLFFTTSDRVLHLRRD